MPWPLKFSERKLIVSFLALVKIWRRPASHMKSSYWLPEIAAAAPVAVDLGALPIFELTS